MLYLNLIDVYFSFLVSLNFITCILVIEHTMVKDIYVTSGLGNYRHTHVRRMGSVHFLNQHTKLHGRCLEIWYQKGSLHYISENFLCLKKYIHVHVINCRRLGFFRFDISWSTPWSKRCVPFSARVYLFHSRQDFLRRFRILAFGPLQTFLPILLTFYDSEAI